MLRARIQNRRVFDAFLKRIEKFGDSPVVRREISVRCARRYRVALKRNIRAYQYSTVPKGVYKGRLGRISKRLERATLRSHRSLLKSGTYINSIIVEKTGNNNYMVSSDAGYAEYLEFGTAKMPAKPHWFPTLDQCVSSGDFDKIVTQFVESYLLGKL